MVTVLAVAGCAGGTSETGGEAAATTDPSEPGAAAASERIVGGTGAYEGWDGSGDMVTRYDADDDRAHPTRERETYTGTVTR